jgi:hypothetical protein
VWYALGLVGAFAFLLNVSLGMWREPMRRFSPQWFLAIHLSVPVIVALRLVTGLPWMVAPALLALAVGGQLVGSRLMRRLRVPVPDAAGPGAGAR